ncbi:MAG: potassium channel protein [Bacteroidetes bacterium HGW-Bacteroidetes-13]|nr:MAG: potassium channel protein [Bacteroidetes bacterium HGW-Bacteroidetes-13]
MIRLFKLKIFIAICLLIFLFLGGAIGYKLLSDISWIDALYMTVITVATVGFKEYVGDSDEIKIFTIFLIISSLIIIAYSLTVISEYIFSKHTLYNIMAKKMQKELDQLSRHVIVCGYGRNGKQAVEKLKGYHKKFVVIEKEEGVQMNRQDTSLLVVKGDASDDETLHKAGIERADFLISALPSDADNLFVVLSARQLNPKMTIISRASQDSSFKKLKLAGANHVIMPDKIGGDHMASLVVVPDLTEFLDTLSIVGENAVNIEEICIKDLPGNLEIKSIRDLDLRKTTGCTIIGLKSKDGTYTINPDPDSKLDINSRIIVLGRPEQIEKLNQLFNI